MHEAFMKPEVFKYGKITRCSYGCRQTWSESNYSIQANQNEADRMCAGWAKKRFQNTRTTGDATAKVRIFSAEYRRY